MSFGGTFYYRGLAGGISLNNEIVSRKESPERLQYHSTQCPVTARYPVIVNSIHMLDSTIATAMADYINSLPVQTVLVGATADEPQQSGMNAAATECSTRHRCERHWT